MGTFFCRAIKQQVIRGQGHTKICAKSFFEDWTRRGNMEHMVTSRRTFLIGVAGGTASGKSSVCQKIMEHLGQAEVSDSQRKVVCISQDSFYKQLSGKDGVKATKGQFDFDHPNALDLDLMLETLQRVLQGEKVEIPVYDYVANARRTDEFLTIYPADVVLFEGILAFYFPQVRELFHMKLFVDTDPDTRLSRRVVRDVQERGRDLDTVLTQYMKFVKPDFEEFCLPTKKFADVIIPRGADNTVAISLIVQHIKDLLASRNHDGDENGDDGEGDMTSNGSRSGHPQPPKRRLMKELSRPH